MKKITLFLLFLIGCDNNPIINKNGLKTQNVILITLDGVRWQEVFQGADKRIINNNINDDIKKSPHSNLSGLIMKYKEETFSCLFYGIQ